MRLAQPVTPRLLPLLRTLGPVAQNARPALRDLRLLLPDVRRVLTGLPALDAAARPAFAATVDAVAGARPIVAGARPYVPDILNGLFGGFGGDVGGYYDANGAYGRVGVYGAGNTLAGLLNAGPAGGESSGNLARCPGAATQPGPDGSNPWLDAGIPCDPEDGP